MEISSFTGNFGTKKKKMKTVINNELLFFRLVEIEKIENPLLVLYVGSAGLVINLIGLLIFHQHSHSHDNHHGHHHHNEDAFVEHKSNVS